MLRFAPPPHAILGFGDTTSSAEARHALRGLLGTEATDAAVERAELAISEVVQNAIDLDAPFAVSMWHAGAQRCVRVEVEDSAPGEAAIKASDSWGSGGFGLRIVEAISDRWGINHHPGSKSVWFEIDY
ncbi:MAG: ATP-binding protein [Ilumatobacteraceae bacterium]